MLSIDSPMYVKSTFKSLNVQYYTPTPSYTCHTKAKIPLPNKMGERCMIIYECPLTYNKDGKANER